MADDQSAMIKALRGVPPDAMPFGVGGPAEPMADYSGGAEGLANHLAAPIKNFMDATAISTAHKYGPPPATLSTDDPPFVDPMPAAGFNAALALSGGGMPAAEKGAAGMFGGKLSPLADLRALEEAKKMVEGGKLPDQVLHDTNWMRHPADHMWRFEIPDNRMKLNYMPPSEGDVAISTVGQLVHHPDAFEHYPQLRNINMALEKTSRYPNGEGYFQPSVNGMAPSIGIQSPNSLTALNTAAHELQHGIQNIEGFSWGSSPSHYAGLIEKGLRANPNLLRESGNDFMDVVNSANPLYHATAGEVEARNVENRLKMTPEIRRSLGPWHTQEVPYKDQYHHDPITGTVTALRDRVR